MTRTVDFCGRTWLIGEVRDKPKAQIRLTAVSNRHLGMWIDMESFCLACQLGTISSSRKEVLCGEEL